MENPTPEDVRALPADADGNGFIAFGDFWSLNVVGSDGEIYTRKNGKIFIAPTVGDPS